jgi:flagellar protein FliS
MTYNHAWNSYRQTSMQTASRGQLVLLLYDGALRFLESALLGFEYDDPLEFNRTISNNILRAQSIITELNSTLNMEQGGQLALTLRGLYEYLDERLTESNLRKTSDGIHESIRRLTVLRDAWRQMLGQSSSPAPTSNERLSLCACG